MTLRKGALLLSIFLCSALLLPLAAYAQFELIFGTDLSIELSPEHPAPGERVHVKAQSSLIDLSTTALTWSAGGKTIASGVGVTDTEVLAGVLGSETRVRVSASENGLQFAAADAFIRPVEIDLLWQADSYVPPFYSGRAMPSAGTSLRMEAMPRFVRNGALLSAANLIYTWKRNGYVIAGASGRGKSRVTIESPALFGSDTISVEAKTSDERLIGVASARIDSQEPTLSLYQDHPVFGIAYHHALGRNDQIPETEATFSVIPYFADANDPDDARLRYEWSVNGVSLESDEDRPSTITINASGSTGEAQIELALTHVANLFLNSSGRWTIKLQSAGARGTPFSTEGTI